MRVLGKVLRFILIIVAAMEVIGNLVDLGGPKNQSGVIAVIALWLTVGGVALYFETRSNKKAKYVEK